MINEQKIICAKVGLPESGKQPGNSSGPVKQGLQPE